MAKLYRICAVGETLHDQWRLRHAVDACIDASATDYVTKFEICRGHYSCGLVTPCATGRRTSYVCIVRPLFRTYGNWDARDLSEWYHANDRHTGVALNDWQQRNTGTGFSVDFQIGVLQLAKRANSGAQRGIMMDVGLRRIS
jgi:hypothetical protein